MKLPDTYAKGNKTVYVVIETPYKSRNKFDYDEETGMFKLGKVLPAGMAFPCDMGFIPGTIGEDGDPLDALILMDEMTYPGCFVECRIVGVIKALQKDKGEKEVRNDRFIAVPAKMEDCDHIKDIKDISSSKINAITGFFENYNAVEKVKFTLLGISGHKNVFNMIDKAKI